MKYFRNVSIGFWSDSKIEDEFSPEDRYFYLYLLTNPNSSICGCFELSNKQAAAETGYSEDTIKVLLDRLENKLSVIRYDKKTKEVLILKWYKYNWTLSEKLYAAIIKSLKYVKSARLKNDILNILFEYKGIKEERTKEENNNIEIEEKEIEIEIEKEIEIEIEKEVVLDLLPEIVSDTDSDSNIDVSIGYGYGIDTVSKKLVKHKYGIAKNVLLTDKEYRKLIEQFPYDYEKRIENLSYYMASKGAKYKDHYMTILNWDRMDKEKVAQKEKAEQKQTKKGRNDFIDELR